MDNIYFSWLELIGTVLAIIYLYFSVNEKIWLWPLGILTSIFYILVFFESRLYADMSLQIYYFVVSVLGWIYWQNKKEESKTKEFPIQKLTKEMYGWLLIIFTFTYFFIYGLLILLPPAIEIASSDMPLWDAFTTAASFVATWMLTRKYIEQWIIWVVVDLVSMIMYVHKEMYITSFLFLIYTIVAFVGYRVWHKSMTLKLVTATTDG